jgi:hypothetical protein
MLMNGILKILKASSVDIWINDELDLSCVHIASE